MVNAPAANVPVGANVIVAVDAPVTLQVMIAGLIEKLIFELQKFLIVAVTVSALVKQLPLAGNTKAVTPKSIPEGAVPNS